MSSPVKLYLKEMYNNVGYFATWLPANTLKVGDFGVVEGGGFRQLGSLSELGISSSDVREGPPQDMSYSASARRTVGASGGVGSVVPEVKAEVSIAFTSSGGYIFEAAGVKGLEIANRLATGERILDAFEQKRWQKEWVLIDSVCTAASATILVSQDSSSEIILKASGDVPLGALPLADPKLGLTVASSSGRIIQLIAKSDLTPLYSCMKIRTSFLDTAPSFVFVRGTNSETASQTFSRLSIEALLES
jgi:hypothetical protein